MQASTEFKTWRDKVNAFLRLAGSEVKDQVRSAAKQLAHIALSLRAFLRLELERIRHGVSWYESKVTVIRGAVSAYLASPSLGLTTA